MTKSSNVSNPTQTNCRESEAELRDIQAQSDSLDREVTQLTTQVRNMRKELRHAHSVSTEAETSRQRVIEEAESIRESLAIQEPDSGRILAYEEAIEVTTCMKLLITASEGRKENTSWTNGCPSDGTTRSSEGTCTS